MLLHFHFLNVLIETFHQVKEVGSKSGLLWVYYYYYLQMLNVIERFFCFDWGDDTSFLLNLLMLWIPFFIMKYIKHRKIGNKQQYQSESLVAGHGNPHKLIWVEKQFMRRVASLSTAGRLALWTVTLNAGDSGSSTATATPGILSWGFASYPLDVGGLLRYLGALLLMAHRCNNHGLSRRPKMGAPWWCSG